MRVHKLTIAALAVAAGLSLTACQGDSDNADGQSTGSSNSSSSSNGAKDTGGKDTDGKSADGENTAVGGGGSDGASDGGSGSGKGSGTDSETAKCLTDHLEITAADGTVGGDPEETVVVGFKNAGAKDCLLTGYAGVDLKTNYGRVSAERTGQEADPVVLKSGEDVFFGVTYPKNDSGGSGVRVEGLVVTPPNETKSVTLDWPGKASLPVTEDGSGTAVQVGPIGSAGQGG
ncbi:DUF4232 domain-containing protein [Streptomyces olivaceus]|uniref:DUF4232 domain-containing protein n=1 Tax=Streptomyces olivaceus TaxID=47716 RepID=A0ABS7W1L5_STROV|nr:DUF4232 domain-containing protein [Streptomyces olivaceus]MBZ6089123.1 DUF4232 domain-containing protein [Streptomyces olivaceus]MBZ6095503.1 DUF4232 domain-containing protein [Streptomyces olivaceus]MBZ6106121.1 DUF4232 domain-containing protein [Streptomyces olivaceus]MBZ6119772.1 DUF4232 domain-containing protein [Streptomyces olivaceus]MBZ6151323.1 DUF4232 domain-containing protein [Streptomyces olivaceus]